MCLTKQSLIHFKSNENFLVFVYLFHDVRRICQIVKASRDCGGCHRLSIDRQQTLYALSSNKFPSEFAVDQKGRNVADGIEQKTNVSTNVVRTVHCQIV